jgi:hypothetical protein
VEETGKSRKEKDFMDIGVLDFLNKKLILYYYFCLKSGPVFLFQIFIIASLLLPIQDPYVHEIFFF